MFDFKRRGGTAFSLENFSWQAANQAVIWQYKGGDILNENRLNFKISEKLYGNLKVESEEKGISLAALVRVILSEYFEKKQK